jgi:hypothetical protein
MNFRIVIRAALLGCVCLVLVVGYALADKPAPGTNSGTGRIFFPNPVASLQDQSLTDQKDEDYATLQPAYKTVTLTNLDGSGYLSGDWATIRGSTGPLAYSSDNTFVYTRKNDQFEQVMAYSWDKHDVLRFGKGGVDDAEDAEVILHEPDIASCVVHKERLYGIRTTH